MSLHSFDPKIAEAAGVNAAILHQNLIFWCEKNAANRKHIRDGRVWTYNSARAFAELFPYLTASQVKTAIKKLIEIGLVIKGDYNLATYDKTNWYSPVAIGDWSPMDWTPVANRLDSNLQPIPDTKPDTKPVVAAADFYLEYFEAHPKPTESFEAEQFFDDLVEAGENPQTIIAAARAYAEKAATFSAHIPIQGSDRFLDPDRGIWRKHIPEIKTKPSPEKVLAYYAAVVLQKKPSAPSVVSQAMVAKLLEAKAVTVDQLREAGVDVD